MTAATELAKALAPHFGAADDVIHTAVPPWGLGGDADVLTFRHAPVAPFTYVTASEGRTEYVLCTREPDADAPKLLSKLARAAQTRSFAGNGTLPLGDGPYAGLLFTWALRLARVSSRGRDVGFLLVVGVPREELEACRTHGTACVVARLKEAGVFPCSIRGRASIPAISMLPPSPLARSDLSELGLTALRAVVDVQEERVESLRGEFEPSDLVPLAASYEALGSWNQRAELMNLLQDSSDARLVALWKAVAGDALRNDVTEYGSGHCALSIALAHLDGDLGRFDAYFGDLDAALARAREVR